MHKIHWNFFLILFFFFISPIFGRDCEKTPKQVGYVTYITKDLNFTDEDLLDFCIKNKNRKEIVIHSCDQITDEGIRVISQLIPDMMALSLMFCPQLSDNSLEHISKMKHLKSLTIAENNQISDEGIFLITDKLLKLENLNFCQCEKITDKAIFSITESFSKLKKLDISGCVLVTDAAIKEISEHLSYLTSISFSLCPLITDRGIFSLCKFLKELREIDMICCPAITDTAIEYITQELPLLEKLSIYGNPQITKSAIDSFLKQKEKLNILALSACDHFTMKDIMEIGELGSGVALLVYIGKEELIKKDFLLIYSELLTIHAISLLNYKIPQKNLEYFKVF